MVSNSNYTKLKTNLQLAIQRLKLLEKKKMELTQKARKEIAEYLSTGKVERAKIRVEHIIREDFLVEAMEIVEMFCDTLIARFGMIEQLKTLDEGLEETVSSLIWVSPRMQSEVKELKVIADILAMKYGKPYAQSARENALKTVNEKLMIKLGVQAPAKSLVENYLIVIAKSLDVPYEPDEEIIQESENYKRGPNSGGGGGGSGGMRDPGAPPPVGPILIDFGLDAGSLNAPSSGHVMPPPLPLAPPSASVPSAHTSSDSQKKGHPGGMGFENLSLHSQNPSAPEDQNSAGHPPSYDSVVSNLPDLSDLPTMPDIPGDDDFPSSSSKNNNKSNPPPNNTSGGGANGNNYDFDDLKRRFDELKNKKY